jgi:hypothetical protein
VPLAELLGKEQEILDVAEDNIFIKLSYQKKCTALACADAIHVYAVRASQWMITGLL